MKVVPAKIELAPLMIMGHRPARVTWATQTTENATRNR
jgi:hypothetical protein